MSRTLSTPAQKRRMRTLFASQFPSSPAAVLGAMTFVDRIYELRCLIELLTRLKTHRPHLRFTLSTGSALPLKEKGGPIDRSAPHIRVYDTRKFKLLAPPDAEIWTNIEFWALSNERTGGIAPTAGKPYGRAHELDILLLKPGCSGRPSTNDILIGIEAKHRFYSKALLKELLGVRREMTLLNRSHPQTNLWTWWTKTVHARPPSGLVAFCAYSNIKKYDQPAAFFDLHMEHLKL